MDFDNPFTPGGKTFIGDPPTDQGPIVGVPKDYVDDLVKKLEAERLLTRQLQGKIDRQTRELNIRNGQIRQLREDKAKLLADLRRAQGVANERTAPDPR